MPTRSRALSRLGPAVAVVVLLALAVPTVAAADRDVAIRDFAFSPGTVEIRAGDTVTWTNRDSVAHTATARNGSFDTGLLEEGQSGRIRFTVAGTYRYLCTPHPEMTGTVVVRAAGPGGRRPPDTDTAPTDTDAGTDRSSGSGLITLAAIGGLAFVLARRAIERRAKPPEDR
jgi:plastocyanin